MKNYTWNYNPPEGFKYYEGYQDDWNQTLISVINQIYVENGFESSCILVKCPIKFEPLINSLYYYDDKRNMLADKYFIQYRDDSSNIINVDGFELEILNFNDALL
jgi:hypothetical protein